jgi:hypothetical protein
MEHTEIDLSDWILLTIGGEEYLIGRGEQTDTLLLSAPLVDLDPAVTPGWAVADGGTRYRLALSKGLRDDQDRRDVAALLTDSLAAWGIPDAERAQIMQQVFGSTSP